MNTEIIIGVYGLMLYGALHVILSFYNAIPQKPKARKKVANPYYSVKVRR